MNAVSPTPRLEVLEVTKSFPGVKALQQVSLRVIAGEVLSVVGENGAGKSTLMKILAGVQSPDSARSFWMENRFRFAASEKRWTMESRSSIRN